MKIVGLIIAVDGVPRNPNLMASLRNFGWFNDVTILEALTPKNIDPEKLNAKKSLSETLLGRSVSEIETSIMLSHELAYKVAREMSADILYVFEDDLEFNSIDPKQLRQIEERIRKPRITLYYSPNWSIWIRYRGEWRSMITPAYAACYSINLRALEISKSQISIGLADWPSWTRLSYFRYKFVDGISTKKDAHSYVENSRKEAKMQKKRIKFFESLSLSCLSPVKIFRFQIYDQAIWKVFQYIKSFDNSISTKSIFIGKNDD